MPKISPQTKSFIVLLVLAVVGCYISSELFQKLNLGLIVPKSQSHKQTSNDILASQQPCHNCSSQNTGVTNAVDTSQWKVYQDKTFGFSFKYKPDWKVLPAVKKGDYTVIEVDPGRKFYNILIYISQKGFYVLDGLPATTEQIAGCAAQNVRDILYGIKKPPYYFTFDVNRSLSLKPNFDALVHSVQFY
jgi:hypothetical protein